MTEFKSDTKRREGRQDFQERLQGKPSGLLMGIT
jgi:hypothetical protein